MSNTIINAQVLKLEEINNSVPFYHRYLLLHSPLTLYSDEYSGRDSSEERSKRQARRDKREKNRKSGRERSVSATRPRVHIGGTGIEESNRLIE